FRSTPPRGGRRSNARYHLVHSQVSIHAPARGATKPRRYYILWRSFDPRPREGGDIVLPRMRAALTVSIHAPARGATLSAVEKRRNYNVSIHAPARGATSDYGVKATWYNVSIHAPARGATVSGINKAGGLGVSIH